MLAPNDDDNKRGNMAQVYFDLQENAERENRIRDADERAGPFAAELVEGVTPKWHAAGSPRSNGN